MVLGPERLGAVQHQESQVRRAQPAPGQLHPQGLDLVAGLAEPGRVHQAADHPPQQRRLLDGVPGGAGTGGDNGPLRAQQPVEQAGLAHVGPPAEHHHRPLPEHPLPLPLVEQAGQGGAGLPLQPGGQLRADDLLHLVGEVHRRLHCGRGRHQGGPHRPEPPGQPAGQGAQGKPGLGLAGRGHQLGHGLGLAQPQAAAQKGAAGELAGLGQAAALGQAQLQHPPGHRRSGVALDLDRVLSAIRMWSFEKGAQHLVHHLAAGRLHDAAVEQAPYRGRVGQGAPGRLEQGAAHRPGPGAGDAHDADAAGTGRGGNGRDGVVGWSQAHGPHANTTSRAWRVLAEPGW